MYQFAIQNKFDEELFWSNSEGWTYSDDFEIFTSEEIEIYRLPIDGVWCRIISS